MQGSSDTIKSERYQSASSSPHSITQSNILCLKKYECNLWIRMYAAIGLITKRSVGCGAFDYTSLSDEVSYFDDFIGFLFNFLGQKRRN